MTLIQKYPEFVKQLNNQRKESVVVNSDNVYQQANQSNFKILDSMIIQDLMKENSQIKNLEVLEDLFAKAQEGKSVALFLEHYSNFDLPCLISLLKNKYNREDIAEKIIALSGVKLNEDHPFVLGFAESFNRIIVYPSQAINKIESSNLTDQEKQEEKDKALAINMKSLRLVSEKKKTGYITVIFPSGTRYREGRPETKKGIKEMEGYLRQFDYIALVSIHGNILHISNENMLDDQCSEEVILFNISNPYSYKDFSQGINRDHYENRDDYKQVIVDNMMNHLEDLHNSLNEFYKKICE